MGENRVSRIIMLGYGTLALGVLEGLLASEDCEVVGVFRWSRHPRFRGRADSDEKKFGDLIRRNGIAEIRCGGVNSARFLHALKKRRADTVLIATWGEILKSPVLSLPNVRFINCHPSLLPEHRGANPYHSAIRNGERRTGVSFHLVEETIDTGPIITQSKVEIRKDDTGETLRQRCASKAQALAPELAFLLNHPDRLTPTSQQDIGSGSYFPALRPQDGLIHWEQTVDDIQNLIRGVQPWVDAYTFAHGLVGPMKLVPHSSVTRSAPRTDLKAGTVSAVERSTIWVRAGNGEQELGLGNVHLWIRSMRLPPGLSRLACPWWIRPGAVLHAMTKSTTG